MSHITTSFDSTRGVTVTDEAVTFAESDVTVSGYSNVVDGSLQYKRAIYDISIANYTGSSFDASSEAFQPTELAWSGDGSKLYVLGNGSATVYAYDVTTAYDLSTASYSGTSLDVSNEEIYPYALTWGGGGSQLYIAGTDTTTVYAYDVTTAYDLSTASYSGTSLGVGSEDGSPYGLAWNGDGSQLYMSGSGTATVYAYDVTTAYDLSTASYSGTSLDTGGETSNPFALLWNGDGSGLYILAFDGTVYAYDVTTAYDLSTASYSGSSFDTSSEDGSPYGLAWNGDGSQLYMIGQDNAIVYAYLTGDDLPVKSEISWSSTPADLKFWDLATYQASPDGGSVTVDIVDGNGTVIVADIDRNADISTVDPDTAVGIRVTLDGTEGEDAPALDYAARRYGR